MLSARRKNEEKNTINEDTKNIPAVLRASQASPFSSSNEFYTVLFNFSRKKRTGATDKSAAPFFSAIP